MVILVDTSVWIDHLHHTNPKLRDLLHHDEIGVHPLVIEELATGSLAARDDTLRYLSYLHRFPVLSHEELLVLVRTHALWGRGLSPVDVHLLGSVALVPSALLWTRDKRLFRAAEELEISYLGGSTA
ncbi:type II toxin-antitoxin system VapC family toxin [Actinomyces gerencseriae]|uniref:type II toxin-antitoxin system VapC family toxin n=1 Tax=Actinomyces gerencseriae TaxID=52769 RepID=UPI001FDEE76A|nr:type II toxin-antitoxin system VapC family toxin [Actinomyces gerencseriae]